MNIKGNSSGNGKPLFDIKNLEQAQKLIDQIFDMSKEITANFNATRNVDSYITQMSKVRDLYKDLQKYYSGGTKLTQYDNSQKYQEEMVYLEEILKKQRIMFQNELNLREEANKTAEVIKEQNRATEESVKLQERLNKEITSFANSQIKDLATGKATQLSINGVISNLTSSMQEKWQKQSQETVNKIRTEVVNSHINNGTFTEENKENIEQEIKDRVDKVLGGSANKLNIASTALTEAGNVIKTGIKTLTGLFSKGITNQSNAYESTFTNISVRNDVSRSQYYSAQAGTNNILNNMGLYNNIRTSDVQQMWNTLASNGVNIDMSTEEARAKTTANAIETVLTNQIVPYLDMSSSYMQQLSDNNPYLMKQIRGIGLSISEIDGYTSVVANSYLKDMLESLSPITQLAEEEIGLQYAESLGVLEGLRNAGLSDSQIGELYNAQKQLVEDPYKAVTSSDVSLRYAAATMIGNGEDTHDIGVASKYYTGSVNMFSNFAPEGKQSNLYAGAIRNNTGIGVSTSTLDTLNSLNIDLDEIYANAQEIKNNVNKNANRATENFKNDKNQTNRTLQETTLENFMNELSIVNEWMGHWTDVAVAALNGIKTILMTWLGGKLLGGVGGKLFGSTAGKAVGTGLGTKALNAVGSGLMDVGLAVNPASNSIAGSIATGAGATLGAAALVGGGTALGVNGVSDAVQDFQSGKTGRGVASTVQGAAGLGAAGVAVGSGIAAAAGGAGLAGGIAAAATNPVGWVLLAAAGGIALGKSLYDSAHNYEKAGVKVEKEFNDLAFNLEQEQMKREENLLSIKDNLKNNKDLEEQRQKLIQTGLLSDEDLQKAQKGNRDALIELTNQYIKSTKDFSNTEQELLEQIKNDKVDEANESAKSIKDWFDNDLKGKNGDTKENNEIAKNLIVNMASQLENKGRSNWSDSEKKFMERYEKNKRDNKWGYNDLRWILEGGGSWGGISDAVMDNATDIFNNTGFATYANSRGKNIKQYESIDMNMLPYATAIKQATNKEEAETAVKAAKDAGMKYSEWKQYIGDVLTEYKIPEFRYGTNEIPYDGYPALLHQGEAVLTASTANEMRNLVDEYRDGKDTSANFDVIIESQTVAIVEKMDEIIAIMNNMSSPLAQQTVNSNSSAKASQLNNMVRMRNSKSWA